MSKYTCYIATFSNKAEISLEQIQVVLNHPLENKQLESVFETNFIHRILHSDQSVLSDSIDLIVIDSKEGRSSLEYCEHFNITDETRTQLVYECIYALIKAGFNPCHWEVEESGFRRFSSFLTEYTEQDCLEWIDQNGGSG